MPSEYFSENIYVDVPGRLGGVQDDRPDELARLMWANDFPHSDATWPWSQEMLAEHTAHLTEHEKRAILHDNVAELYSIDLSTL